MSGIAAIARSAVSVPAVTRFRLGLRIIRWLDLSAARMACGVISLGMQPA